MRYPELRGRIRYRFQTQTAFAKAMGMSPCSVSKKLNGRTEWTAAEIRKISDLLDIPPIKIPQYFFCSNC